MSIIYLFNKFILFRCQRKHTGTSVDIADGNLKRDNRLRKRNPNGCKDLQSKSVFKQKYKNKFLNSKIKNIFTSPTEVAQSNFGAVLAKVGNLDRFGSPDNFDFWPAGVRFGHVEGQAVEASHNKKHFYKQHF